MVHGREVIGIVFFFDILVIGGYLLLTEPLDTVIWIVPTFVLFGLIVAAYLFKRLSGDSA